MSVGGVSRRRACCGHACWCEFCRKTCSRRRPYRCGFSQVCMSQSVRELRASLLDLRCDFTQFLCAIFHRPEQRVFMSRLAGRISGRNFERPPQMACAFKKCANLPRTRGSSAAQLRESTRLRVFLPELHKITSRFAHKRSLVRSRNSFRTRQRATGGDWPQPILCRNFSCIASFALSNTPLASTRPT